MENFRRNNRFGGGRDSRRSSFGDKKMYKAVCAECGKDCEVPFKPTGNKPVLCSECFGKVSRSKGSSQSTKQLETIEAKLDKILKLLTPVASVEKKEKKKVIKKEKAVKPKKISKAKEKKVVVSKKTKTKKKK